MSVEEDRASFSYSAKLNVHTFTELFRIIDATASTKPGQKRKRRSAVAEATTTHLGITDWAKARAQIHIDKRRAINDDEKRAGLVPKPEVQPASPTYSPFSKASLLARIATYALTSYGVRTRVYDILPRGLSASEAQPATVKLASLAHWLDPVGPALHGWSHVPPPKGRQNLLICYTCAASIDILLEDLRVFSALLRQVKELQTGHRTWCPWRRRACDRHLYSLGGVIRCPADDEDRYVVRATSRLRARRALLTLSKRIDAVMRNPKSADRVSRPSSLRKDLLDQLQDAMREVSISQSTDGTSSAQSREPSSDSLLLALFGWTPWDPPSATVTSKSASSRSTMVTCGFCSRKVNVQRAGRPIEPVHEHRTFCPWINAEAQEGTYLLPYAMLRSGQASEGKLQAEEELPQADDDESALTSFLKISEPVLLSGVQSSPTHAPHRASTPVSNVQTPAWERVLQKVLDLSPADVPRRDQSNQGACIDASSGETASDGPPSLSLRASLPSSQKTSDVLKTAKALLYGLNPNPVGHQSSS